jgi:hypothetical protein
LTGTVNPANATNQTIVWSVRNAGTTGATISGNTLNISAAGTVTVTATIVNCATATANYVQDFDIAVSPPTGNGAIGQPQGLPLRAWTQNGTLHVAVSPFFQTCIRCLKKDIKNVLIYRL